MKIKSEKGNKQQVYRDAAEIRRQVFVNEQGISAELEFDGRDGQVIHYVGYEGAVPVTTVRVDQQGDQVNLQRVATVKDGRHRGFAATLLNEVIHSFPVGTTITLGAQETAVGFYEQLGFKIVGEPFEEVGITHFEMVFKR